MPIQTTSLTGGNFNDAAFDAIAAPEGFDGFVYNDGVEVATATIFINKQHKNHYGSLTIRKRIIK